MPLAEDNTAITHQAVHDFQEARRKAALESLLSRLSGKSTDLLSYDEVRQRLRIIESANRRLQEIPIKSIVGSVIASESWSLRTLSTVIVILVIIIVSKTMHVCHCVFIL